MSHEVGKPSLKTVIGDGDCKQINMSNAGQVVYLDRSRKFTGASRDADQNKSHLKIRTDTGTLNRPGDD